MKKEEKGMSEQTLQDSALSAGPRPLRGAEWLCEFQRVSSGESDKKNEAFPVERSLVATTTPGI